MTKLQCGEIDVCTFCWNSHQRWGKNHQFNKIKKEKAQSCFICKEPMCCDCVQDSQHELDGTLLGKF